MAKTGQRSVSNGAQRRVMKYLGQIGRRDLRVHDARHTFITNLLKATNGNIFLAARLAGHADERQIVRTYGHLLLDDPIRAARALAEWMGRPGPVAAGRAGGIPTSGRS